MGGMEGGAHRRSPRAAVRRRRQHEPQRGRDWHLDEGCHSSLCCLKDAQWPQKRNFQRTFPGPSIWLAGWPKFPAFRLAQAQPAAKPQDCCPQFLAPCSYYAIDKNAENLRMAINDLDLPPEKLKQIRQNLFLEVPEAIKNDERPKKE